MGFAILNRIIRVGGEQRCEVGVGPVGFYVRNFQSERRATGEALPKAGVLCVQRTARKQGVL